MSDLYKYSAREYESLYSNLSPGQTIRDYQSPLFDDIKQEAEAIKQEKLRRTQEMSDMLPVSDWEYDIIKGAITRALESGANEEDERYRWATGVMYSRQFGMDLSSVMSNFDSLNKWYLGTDKAPAKTNWQAMADAWNVGKLTYDLSQVTRQWFEGGGTDSALEAQADAISGQIESMQDKAPRPWIVEAFKAGLQSAPFTLSAMAASASGSVTATSAALFAAGAAGLVVGTGGIGAVPLALIAAFGTAGGVAGGFMQSSRDTVGLEYYRMRKAGVTDDIAGPLSAVSANIQGLIEVSLGNVAGMVGKIGGKAGIETLTGAVVKRLATQNVLGPVARGLMGYGGMVLEEGLEEGLQQLTSNGSDILARELSDQGVGELEARKIGDQVFESVKQGMMASIVMGVPGTMLQTKGNVQEAKALAGMAKQLDQEDFIRKAKESAPSLIADLPEAQQDAVLTKIWNAQESRRTAQAPTTPISAEEQVAEVEGSTQPGTKAPAIAEKRLKDNRLYTMEKITTGETSEGFAEGIIKSGDPTPGSGRLYSYAQFAEDEDSVTITNIKAEPGYRGTVRDLVVELASRKPGKEIIWNPKSQALQAIKQDLIENNPRGQGAGLNWFDIDQDVGSIIAKQDIKRQIKEQGTAYFDSDIKLEMATKVLELRANSIGIGLDEYMDAYHQKKLFGDASVLSAAQGKKGGVLFKEVERAVKAMFYFSKNADFSTWVHENAHVFRRQLAGDLKTAAESYYKVKDGKWTVKQEEQWSRDLERYILKGEAPTEGLKAIFQKFANFMREIYKTLGGKVDIDPRIRKVFDALFSDTRSPISQTAETARKTGRTRDTYSKNIDPATKPKQQSDAEGNIRFKTISVMAEADFSANPPNGFRYDAKLKEEANHKEGIITLGKKFFMLKTAGERLHVLYHEAGHYLSDLMLKDGSAFDLADKGAFGPKAKDGTLAKGINGQVTPGENVAEAYAVLMDDPAWLMQNYPAAYSAIMERAKQENIPVPQSDAEVNIQEGETTDPENPSILYQTDEELLAEAKDFDTWEEWRDFNQAMVDPEDMTREQKQNEAAWYKAKWEEAHRPVMTTEDGKTALDPEQLDTRFIESMADEETLNGFLGEIGDIVNEKFRENATDQEEHDQQERTRALQGQIPAEVHTTIQLNAQSVANGKTLTPRARKQILTLMKQAPRAYRALYADITGAHTYAVTDEQMREVLPEIQDPELGTARRMTITERVRYANKIKNETIAQKIRSGNITEAEILEHADYLKKQNAELTKTITAKEAEIEKDEIALSAKDRKIAENREKLDTAERELAKADREIKALQEQKRRVSDRLREKRQDAALNVYNLKRQQNLRIQGERALAYVEKKKALKDLKEEHRDRTEEVQAMRRLRVEKLRLAKRIMAKVSDAVHVKEREDIEAVQANIDPKFRKMTDRDKERIKALNPELKNDPNAPKILGPRMYGLITGKNLTSMTLEELESTAATIDAMKKEGRYQKSLLIMRRNTESAMTRTMIENTITASGKLKTPSAYGSQEAKQERRGIRSFFRNADYAFLNMQRKAMIMDNGQEGENSRLLVTEERRHRRDKLNAIRDREKNVMAAMEKAGLKLKDLFITHELKGIGPDGKSATFTVDDLMYAFLANLDSNSSQAVAYGNLMSAVEKSSLSPLEVAGLGARRLNKLLEQANTILTDKHRMVMDAIKEDFKNNFERLNQVAVDEFNKRVERVEFYVPLYRKEMTYDNLAEAIRDDLLNLNAGASTTLPKKGMIEERITIAPEHQKPVEMGLFSVWRKAVEMQEHFINYTGYVRDINNVYKTGRGADTTRAMISGAYGPEMIQNLDDHINELANPSVFIQKDNLSKSVRALRGDLGAAYLGYKMSSIVTQLITSPMPYLAYLKNPGRLIVNYFKFLSWPPGYKSAWAEISGKSAIMRDRSMDPIMETIKQGQLDNPAGKGLAKMKEIGMKGLEWADRVSVMAGWKAVYDEAMIENGGNEQAAIEKADDVTLKIQPTGEAADLAPAFKTKSEAWRVFLQFQAALNVIWQNIRYDLPTAIKNREFGRAVGIVTSYALAGALLGLAKKGFKDDDDEPDKEGLKMLYWSMTQFSDAAPLFGSQLSTVLEKLVTGDQTPFFETSLYPAAGKLFTGVSKATSGEFGKAALDFGQAIGYAIGAPVSGVKDVIRAAQADGAGDIIGKLAGRRE